MKNLQEIENAIISPTNINRNKQSFSGCVYDQTGHLLTASQRTKRNVAWVPDDPDTINPKIISKEVGGRCLYLGHYTGHYGHFILETLSRFWALQSDVIYDKFIFHPFVHNVPNPRFFSPAKTCFKSFGIKSKQVLIVNQFLSFKNLTVPSALLEINNRSDTSQSLIYKHIGHYCKNKSDSKKWNLRKLFLRSHISLSKTYRIYMSRRNYNSIIMNEIEIERIFTSLGFSIIHPQLLSFEQQVILYQQVDIMAGLNGSAMHNSVFMKSGALAITIGDIRQPEQPHINQQICDSLSMVKSAFIAFKEKAQSTINNKAQFNIDYLRSQMEEILKSAG